MEKIEILAPAGSKESFISAVEAGADAVYCGLNGFSARAKAENFTPAEFNNYVNYAHSKNVKVYAAFNTLVKQSELKEAAKNLGFIAAAKADAVIVQDLGILNIMRKHFPQLKIHASTQMTIHNSYGALEAGKAGFKRAVLARELSLREIETIAAKSNIEIEVFVHGALCFCVSGICLMSSFIGGYSGNRGLCAQPCRRKWKFKNKDGFYLSPKDLELASFIPELKKAGVTSLKIEGRMKNPQYVYKTVKAYKMLACADNNNFREVLEEASKTLSQDFARKKTAFNFNKAPEDIFEPAMSKQLGVNLGKILSAENGIITLKTDFNINRNDALKAADVSKDVYFKFNILKAGKAGGVYTIETDCCFLKSGMEIFKTSDGDFGAFLKEAAGKVKIEKLNFTANHNEVKDPVFKKTAGDGEESFVRIDDTGWSREIPRNFNIIFSLNKDNLNAAENLKNINFFELPPYIEEDELPLFQKAVNNISKNAKAVFFINNISHFRFFDGKTKLLAGQFLYCANSFSAGFLFEKGISGFVFSWEDDFKNIAELSKAGLGGYGIFYLSGFPALAVSKMKMHKDLSRDELIDCAKDSFRLVQRNGTAFVLPQYPVMLFNKKQQLKKIKINKFAIDLSFMKPDKNYAAVLFDAYYGKRPLHNEYEFNFERELK
ncbi:MAG: U32 family peptidase [Endomicrobia bacterium]|nr:U32 family peptidase [Endomicrobiia bacterium]